MRSLMRQIDCRIMECPLFMGCDHSHVAELIRKAEISQMTFHSGDYLMRRESEVHVLGILLKGSAIVKRRTKSGAMHMSRLSACDLFGAASIFCGNQPYVVDIQCITDCRVLFISEQTLMEWMGNEPCILRNYLEYLNRRIRFLNQRLDALSGSTVPSKIMMFLQSASDNGVCRIKSYTELAESLCLSRATLYRALDLLSGEGRILRDGKKIMILEEIYENS